MKPARLFWLLLFSLLFSGARPAFAFQLLQEAERGHEVYSGRLLLMHLHQNSNDSLRLNFSANWRDGFRGYNSGDRRLSQQLNLLLYHNLHPSLQLLGRFEEKLYNEKRFQRENFILAAEAGLGWKGPLNASLLAGWTRNRRTDILEDGIRLRGSAGADLQLPDWLLHLDNQALWEEPGARQNRNLQSTLELRWTGEEALRQSLRLSYLSRQEDVAPDSRQQRLERRLNKQVRLGNTFETVLWEFGHFHFDLDAWSGRQQRGPQQSEVQSSSGDSRDLGIQAAIGHGMSHGKLYHSAALRMLRQSLQDAYGYSGQLSETNSQVLLNRVEGLLGWKSGFLSTSDSLQLKGSAELRRRDTEFEGALYRPDDFTDHALRDLSLEWVTPVGGRHSFRMEFGILLQAERHQQAEHSRNNHLRRTWQAGTGHALRFRRLQVHGKHYLLADYRLYDFDNPEEPRSWLQRRLRMEEEVLYSLQTGLPGLWKLRWPLVWIEEDGGSYHRADALERISNSSREWSCSPVLDWRRGGLMLSAGLNWFSRRDYQWTTGRHRLRVRTLYRRGPAMQARLSKGSHRLLLYIQQDWVQDKNQTGASLDRRDLSGRIEWRFRP